MTLMTLMTLMTYRTIYQILDPLEQFDVIKLMPFINFGLTNLTTILLINLLLTGFFNYTAIYTNQSHTATPSVAAYKFRITSGLSLLTLPGYDTVSSHLSKTGWYRVYTLRNGELILTLVNDKGPDIVLLPPSGATTIEELAANFRTFTSLGEKPIPRAGSPGGGGKGLFEAFFDAVFDTVMAHPVECVAGVLLAGFLINHFLIKKKKTVDPEMSEDLDLSKIKKRQDLEMQELFSKLNSKKEKKAEFVSKWGREGKYIQSYEEAMAAARDSKDLWLLPGIFISGTGLGEIATWLGFFAVRRFVRHQIKRLLQKEYKNLISLKVRSAKVFACLTPNALNSFFLMDAVWVRVWLVVIPNISQYKQYKYKKRPNAFTVFQKFIRTKTASVVQW